MAGARAIRNFADLVVHSVAIGVRVVFVRTGLVVAFVAAGAIRLIRRRFPSHRVRIRGVTADASEIERRTMIARVIARGQMPESIRRPCSGRMTVVAIEIVDRERHMSQRHPFRRRAVVTRFAVIGDAGVTERGGFPRQSGVAAIAFLRGRDMRRGFAGGGDAVVTAATGAGDMGVVDTRNRLPRCSGVAAIAAVVACNVAVVLAGCSRTVVTGRAGTHDLSVIDAYRRLERRRIVAAFAAVAARDMRSVLSGSRAPVVAAKAIGGNAGVIESSCRFPSQATVAVAAIGGGLHVTGRFAGGRYAVMTGRTSAEYLRVIDLRRRFPRGGGVAILA